MFATLLTQNMTIGSSSIVLPWRVPDYDSNLPLGAIAPLQSALPPPHKYRTSRHFVVVLPQPVQPKSAIVARRLRRDRMPPGFRTARRWRSRWISGGAA